MINFKLTFIDVEYSNKITLDLINDDDEDLVDKIIDVNNNSDTLYLHQMVANYRHRESDSLDMRLFIPTDEVPLDKLILDILKFREILKSLDNKEGFIKLLFLENKYIGNRTFRRLSHYIEAIEEVIFDTNMKVAVIPIPTDKAISEKFIEIAGIDVARFPPLTYVINKTRLYEYIRGLTDEIIPITEIPTVILKDYINYEMLASLLKENLIYHYGRNVPSVYYFEISPNTSGKSCALIFLNIEEGV